MHGCRWMNVLLLKICFFIGKAFCASHCIKVAELGYPTDLKEFLRSCSDTRQTVDPDEYSKPMKQRVDEELKMIAKKMEGSPITVPTATEAQGTSYLLRNTAFRDKRNFVLEGSGEDCNK